MKNIPLLRDSSCVREKRRRSIATVALTSILLLWALGASPVLAVPGETTNLGWCSGSKTCLEWTPTPQAVRYAVYRGIPSQLPMLLNAGVDSCDRRAHNAQNVAFPLDEVPAAGSMFWYLVVAENACGQGPAGNATAGQRVLNASGFCQPWCSNGVLDGDESDTDCGGPSCAPCGTGKTCFGGIDCASVHCTAGQCVAPSCTDGLNNGSESEIDCGGSCPPCGVAQICCVSGDCLTGNCVNGACQGLPQGSACASPSLCQSGFCVDGVCCNNSCTGTCRACSAAKKGSGANGTCGNVANGTDPDAECPGAAVCNGSGSCVAPNGTPCAVGAECQSGNCVDSVCCNTTCASLCQACSMAKTGMASGTCANVTNGTDPDNECPGVCNNGACASANGTACVINANCASNFCVDGFCCNVSCSGLCQACSAARKGSGANGTCGNVANGTDPDNECAGVSTCNGAGACTP